MTKPNFFIVGVQKCGTTAIYTYLDAHPDIFMSPVKEPHFFGSDDTSMRLMQYRGDINQYLALFKDATTERAIGEASPSYLLSQVAAQEIYDFNPDSRIIIMLRSPIDLIYSMYHHARFMGDEPMGSFEGAILPELKKGWAAHTNRTYSYLKIAVNSERIQRYLDVFPREQVKIILFDDFKSNLPSVYQDTLNFLGVDEQFVPEFTIVNASKQIRSERLQKFLEATHLTPSHIRDASWFVAISKLLPASLHMRLIDVGKRLYAQDARYPDIPIELRTQLITYFQPEVEALSHMLNRDLSHWLQIDQEVSAQE